MILIQVWTKAGLELRMREAQSFIFVLFFINYCINFYMNNCKPSFVHYVFNSKFLQSALGTDSRDPLLHSVSWGSDQCLAGFVGSFEALSGEAWSSKHTWTG